jgi:ABC-type uncharacterized transport system involved in gliding motility auxiliary subunit
MSSTSTSAFGRLGLATVAGIFVVLVVVTNSTLTGMRLDLTENRLYTLADGTQNILESIPETVNLYLFYSDKATGDLPYLRTYSARVRELLEEFAERADGRLAVHVLDPVPFSEEEDRAAGFGLQAISLGNSVDPVYFGLAGTNSVGDEEIIGFLDPSKEAFLEYDVAKLVHTLSAPDKPVVGLLSSLPMETGFDPQTQQMRQPWIVMSQIQQLFEVRSLTPDMTVVDDDIEVLMVVHPKSLSSEATYAIDQFVLGGGKLLLFVDPFSETDMPAPDPGNPAAAMMASRASALPDLLSAWGLEIPDGLAVGDEQFALTVGGAGQRPLRHIGLIGLSADVMDDDDVVTAGLDTVNFGYPGHIVVSDEASATVTPLVTTSQFAGTLDTARLAFLSSPDMLRDGFSVAGSAFVVAARISGELGTAFPGGAPVAVPDAAPPASDSGADSTSAGDGHLSSGTANIVLVADTDLLTDRLWAQAQNFFGQRIVTAFASNGDFVINALDNLAGSNDLISIRAGATYTRPFDRVQDLRREAENQFRDTEQQLQQQLRETETKLGELQANREDASAMILTAEQEAELDRFSAERLKIRQELRQVQRSLDQNIEGLGTLLKVMNIALVPLLVFLLSMVLLMTDRRRGS